MAMTSQGISELAAVLKRVSTDMTRQEITHQDGDIARVVTEGSFRVMRTFELEASAYTGEHAPALAEILNDVRAGEYTVVIAAMTSRFERRGWKALMRWMLDLDEAGGRLIAADNPSFGDLSTPMGGMLTIMTGDNDHAYSDAISKNVRRGNETIDTRKATRAGGHHSGMCQFAARAGTLLRAMPGASIAAPSICSPIPPWCPSSMSCSRGSRAACRCPWSGRGSWKFTASP
jgi:hypothetical protein